MAVGRFRFFVYGIYFAFIFLLTTAEIPGKEQFFNCIRGQSAFHQTVLILIRPFKISALQVD